MISIMKNPDFFTESDRLDSVVNIPIYSII